MNSQLHRIVVARQAMATRFEMVLHGDNPVALRAAAEEALEEVERIEARISLYRTTSEVARVNARAHQEPVKVSPPVFRLLEQAQQLARETGGAFDITIAPLMRCWGLSRGSGRIPSAEELCQARACVGMDLVCLDSDRGTVRFKREGVMLDLGAMGKGYAVEQAVGLLREAGIASAFIHGGTSSIYAMGRPPDQEAWKVALEVPAATAAAGADIELSQPRTPVAVVALRDDSLSLSAIWGKSFVVEGKTYGHILDPRTGLPADQAIMAAVVLPSATETDALSTALLVLGKAGHARLTAMRPGLKTFLAQRQGQDIFFEGHGIATDRLACLTLPGSSTP
ncbi:MAG: FAD:protein FMN transferase [Verrucomicrobia bacterium]|nr:FAD:protein FMN transferase [Verrucomicrobiota bacterium]